MTIDLNCIDEWLANRSIYSRLQKTFTTQSYQDASHHYFEFLCNHHFDQTCHHQLEH